MFMSSLRILWWPLTLLAWIQLWHQWTEHFHSLSINWFSFPAGIKSIGRIGIVGTDIISIDADSTSSRRDSNPKSPIHIHLSLTDEPSQVLIQFTKMNEGIPVAVYGWKRDSDEEKAIGTSTTFSSNDLCQASTSITPGHVHTVLLSNLQPDTRYHYQVGITVGQGIIWSESVMYFQSPPTSDQAIYSLVVLANQGTIDGQDSVHAISKLVESHSIHAVHHLGGLSYARGNLTMWDQWFRMIQVYASQVPLLIGVGSTEYDYLAGTGDPSGVNQSYTPTWGNYGNNDNDHADSGGECGVVVSKLFQMPRGGNGVFWYRHEAPLLTTLVLSSEHDASPSSPQYQWLQKELQQIQPHQWIILEIHRPLYMNQAMWSDNNVGLGLRRSVEPLLKNKVHLVLSGHYNAYFRSCPGLFQSRCCNGGPTHITVGNAGSSPLLTVNTTDPVVEWYPASWAMKTIGGTRGFGRVTVHNRSTLEFQWIGLNGNVLLDHVWMTK